MGLLATKIGLSATVGLLATKMGLSATVGISATVSGIIGDGKWGYRRRKGLSATKMGLSTTKGVIGDGSSMSLNGLMVWECFGAFFFGFFFFDRKV